VGRSLRFRAALLLLPLPLLLLHSQAARSDDRCAQWVGVPLSLKRKAVQDSFDEQQLAVRDAHTNRCLRDSTTRMAAEIDDACRSGGNLAEVWRSAGMGWIVTCMLVADRVQTGTPSTTKLRTDLRAAVAKCLGEGKNADACTQELRVQAPAGPGAAGGSSECRRFLALPRESRLAEVEDRIRERFSTTPDVARCMNAEAKSILDEVSSLCRRAVEAPKAWSQALDMSTDRCLQNDIGF